MKKLIEKLLNRKKDKYYLECIKRGKHYKLYLYNDLYNGYLTVLLTLGSYYNVGFLRDCTASNVYEIIDNGKRGWCMFDK